MLPPKAITKSGGVAKYHVLYKQCVQTLNVFSVLCAICLQELRGMIAQKKLHSCTFPLRQFLGQKNAIPSVLPDLTAISNDRSS